MEVIVGALTEDYADIFSGDDLVPRRLSPCAAVDTDRRVEYPLVFQYGIA
jgi:hypothetical protein